MSGTLLQVRRLCGGYGDTRVLRDIDVAVSAGQVLGVIGRNGVGKTTLARLLAGALPLQSGDLHWAGRSLTASDQVAMRRLGIGYGPQENGVFDTLSVADNLALTGVSAKDPQALAVLALFPRLRERWAQQAGTMSGGERKILSFVRCLIEPTRLVILDEPTEGVQQENIDLMAQRIEQQSRLGRAFIIMEQNLGLVQRVCDQVIGLDQGRVVLRGDAATLSRDDLLAVLRV
ncbi:MAG: ATP-binding cassette domain-containing protein [Burkholderiaceae bacterium]